MKLQANFTSTAVKQVSQQMTEEKMSAGKKKRWGLNSNILCERGAGKVNYWDEEDRESCMGGFNIQYI